MLYYCYFRPLILLHERFSSKSTVNQQYQLRQLGNWTHTLWFYSPLVFQYLFKHFALVASNRRLFASHFLFYSLSIFLIITTIKSSLALSLGLVGALSIIRFRTAIKEPEQIIFLLGLTAIAIALAAEQFLLSTFVVTLFAIVAVIRYRRYAQNDLLTQDFLILNFNFKEDSQKLIQDITRLTRCCSHDKLRNSVGAISIVVSTRKCRNRCNCFC